MTCSTCHHWNPKQSGAMAKHHMAVCNLGPKWQFMPPAGKCSQWKEAPKEVAENRIKWLQKGATNES